MSDLIDSMRLWAAEWSMAGSDAAMITAFSPRSVVVGIFSVVVGFVVSKCDQKVVGALHVGARRVNRFLEAALMRLPVFRSLADLTSAGVRPIVLNSPYSWVSQSR